MQARPSPRPRLLCPEVGLSSLISRLGCPFIFSVWDAFPPDLLWKLLPQVLTKCPLLREPSPWGQKLYSSPPLSPPSGWSSGSSPHPILPMVQQALGIHDLFTQPVSAPEDPHPGVQGPVCMVHHCILTPCRAGPQQIPAGA